MGGKRLLAVVHMVDAGHAADETQLAIEHGADGVFLINHFDSHEVLLGAVGRSRENVGATAWIGINPLGLDCVAAAEFVRRVHEDAGGVDGLWCDNAQIDEAKPIGAQDRPRAAQAARENWPGLYFGGVAFKYQRHVTDLTAAAETASPYMDVVCTSGPGTGHAADLAQLAALNAGLEGSHRLAVASGVTPANVALQLPYCDWFLVATGISKSGTDLDPTLVKELADRIHEGPDPSPLVPPT